MSQKTNAETNSTFVARLIFVPLFIVLAIWFAVGFLFAYAHWAGKHAGPFGDSFGMVNSLFSGLGLAAVAITLYLQYRTQTRQERELAKQERQQTETLQLLKDQTQYLLYGTYITTIKSLHDIYLQTHSPISDGQREDLCAKMVVLSKDLERVISEFTALQEAANLQRIHSQEQDLILTIISSAAGIRRLEQATRKGQRAQLRGTAEAFNRYLERATALATHREQSVLKDLLPFLAQAAPRVTAVAKSVEVLTTEPKSFNTQARFEAANQIAGLYSDVITPLLAELVRIRDALSTPAAE